MNDVNKMGRKVEVDANDYVGGGLPKLHAFKARVMLRSELHKHVVRC
jgi:hypothetical protein